MSTGSKPKEQIAACPICVLPRKPQPPGPTTLNPPPDTIAERFRTRILIPVCQGRVAICGLLGDTGEGWGGGDVVVDVVSWAWVIGDRVGVGGGWVGVDEEGVEASGEVPL